MSIEEELAADLREAMRTRDRRRMDVIRQIANEVSRAKSEPGFKGEVDDDLYLQVISAFVKKMGKARQEFVDAGERGADHAAKLEWEIGYLEQWLPEAVTEDDARVLVRAAIAELDALNRAKRNIAASGQAGTPDIPYLYELYLQQQQGDQMGPGTEGPGLLVHTVFPGDLRNKVARNQLA